jgi:hypothetical protein
VIDEVARHQRRQHAAADGRGPVLAAVPAVLPVLRRAELEQRRDGILIDHLPKALRPFRQHIFGPSAQRLMRRLGVAGTLGEDNRAARGRRTPADRGAARP